MTKKIVSNNWIKAILVFFIFYYSSYFQLIPISLFHIKSFTPALKVLLNVFSNMILVFIFYFMYRDELIKEWKIFKDNKLECLNTGFCYWILGFVIMIISNTIITYVFHGTGANNEKVVQSMIDTLPWIMFVNAGLFAPFNEEIVFRKSFKNVFTNKWVFAIMSGLIFGFLHVSTTLTSSLDLLYIVPYGVFGFTFALAYYKTNTFFTSFFCHMAHNSILILLSILVM